MAKTQTGQDQSIKRLRTTNRAAVERIDGESVLMIREALRAETRAAFERASAVLVSAGRVHDGQHLTYYVALLARLADVVSGGGTVVHYAVPTKDEEWFSSYAKPVRTAGDVKATPETVVGTASTIFAGKLCEALAECRVDAAGLSALAFVAAQVPIPVRDDIDARGSPRPTGILPFGLLPDAPRESFISVQDRSDALMVLPGRARLIPTFHSYRWMLKTLARRFFDWPTRLESGRSKRAAARGWTSGSSSFRCCRCPWQIGILAGATITHDRCVGGCSGSIRIAIGLPKQRARFEQACGHWSMRPSGCQAGESGFLSSHANIPISGISTRRYVSRSRYQRTVITAQHCRGARSSPPV